MVVFVYRLLRKSALTVNRGTPGRKQKLDSFNVTRPSQQQLSSCTYTTDKTAAEIMHLFEIDYKDYQCE